MTKQAIQSLIDEDLWAIVRSTNPAGALWVQLVWAREELARRMARS